MADVQNRTRGTGAELERQEVSAMKWTSRDKYPCYGCEKRTPGCQDSCPDMREAKERETRRKEIERGKRALEADLHMVKRSGREKER